MTPERWREIARIYEAAVDLDGAARGAFLTEVSAGDDELRAEVESLLRDGPSLLIDQPVWQAAAPLFDDGPELEAGDTLGPYQVERLLGAGGMGHVYLATDSRLNRRVAIKVLAAGVSRDSHAAARFEREARAVAALTHPNICTLYDIGREDQVDYLVMEYIEGDTLAARLAQGPLSLHEALAHAQAIAAALDDAHRHGIIHRDLKPANIMFAAGAAKLLDFGLAKFRTPPATDSTAIVATPAPPAPRLAAPSPAERSGDASNVSRDGTIRGTVRYMSPEQITSRGVDPRSDIFAFGAVLYEMLTGRPAFDGEDVLAIRGAILEGEPATPGAPRPPLPRAVDEVLRRCLAKNPDDRWQTAGELADALRQASRSLEHGRVETGGPSRRRTLIAVASVAALTALAVWLAIGRWPFSSPHRPSPEAIRALAVLPFANASPEQEYFANEITAQLTADLSRIDALRVIAETSTLGYRNDRKPAPVIARELDVDAVVAGDVAQSADAVKITARLIDGSSGEVVWSQQFEGPPRDLLRLQRELAHAVASQVDRSGARRAPDGAPIVAQVDPDLHRRVLLGRYHAAQATEPALHTAIEHFESVLARDPRNALALAGLAEAYIDLSGYYVHPRQAMPKAKQAAEAALKLDDDLADAHAALGYIHLVYDWDGAGAERHLLRALSLNPTLAMARLNYAAYLASQGRNDEAAQEIRTAVTIDPLSNKTYAFGTLFMLFTRRYEEAIELGRRGLEVEPRSAFAMAFQGAGYSALGRHEEAIASLARAVQLDSSLTLRALRAHVLAAAGRQADALLLVRQIEEETRAKYFCPYEIATVYVTLGDQDTATRWFRKGIDDKADCMPWLGVEPWMDPYRADPRYAGLLAEIGLTPLVLPSR